MFKQMYRRLFQKDLINQICEFVNSKYCTGRKEEHRKWLLDFVEFTRARSAIEIKYSELEDFSRYILSIGTPYTAIKAETVVRKFLKFCLLKSYIYKMPDEVTAPTDQEVHRLTRMITKTASNRYQIVNRVAELRRDGLTFEKVAEKLTEEYGKKFYRPNICKLYNDWLSTGAI